MIVVAGIAIALAYHAKPQAGSWRRGSTSSPISVVKISSVVE